MRVSAFHRSSLSKGLCSVVVGFVNLGLQDFYHFFNSPASKRAAECASSNFLRLRYISRKVAYFYPTKQNDFKEPLKTIEHVHKR